MTKQTQTGRFSQFRNTMPDRRPRDSMGDLIDPYYKFSGTVPHRDIPGMTFEQRMEWAADFLQHYADGNREKLLGEWDFNAAVKHLAGAAQQLALPEKAPDQARELGPHRQFGDGFNPHGSGPVPIEPREATTVTPVAVKALLDEVADHVGAMARSAAIANVVGHFAEAYRAVEIELRRRAMSACNGEATP